MPYVSTPEDRSKARAVARDVVIKEQGEGATKPWLHPVSPFREETHTVAFEPSTGKITRDGLWMAVMRRDYTHEPGYSGVMSRHDQSVRKEIEAAFVLEYHKRWKVTSPTRQPMSTWRSVLDTQRQNAS